MIVSIRFLCKLVLLALLLLALGGCGGDDEDKSSVTTLPYEKVVPQGTTGSETETQPAKPNPATETQPNDGNGTGTGESGQGGAGDEVPAQTLALFTGKNGQIAPRTVRVPAFISIRVELRSADGAPYALKFGDRTIEVPDELRSVSTTFDGLKPGQKLVGTASGAAGQVTVEATAEPGP
jgi:hypothetical protein